MKVLAAGACHPRRARTTVTARIFPAALHNPSCVRAVPCTHAATEVTWSILKRRVWRRIRSLLASSRAPGGRASAPEAARSS